MAELRAFLDSATLELECLPVITVPRPDAGRRTALTTRTAAGAGVRRAQRMAADRAKMVDGLVDMLASEIAPKVAQAPTITCSAMLAASVHESVAAACTSCRTPFSTPADGRTRGCVQYTRRLAQRAIPLSALLARRTGWAHAVFV